MLGRADERGVDVRGLVWRSHTGGVRLHLRAEPPPGRALQQRGAEALLDMRVRLGGSHHQKLVVIRHRDDPTPRHRVRRWHRPVPLPPRRRRAPRRPAGRRLAKEYGETPPWHDIQAAISGPAVHDVETVFRERWEDPTPLSRSPLHCVKDRLRGLDLSPDPLPAQAPPPPPVEGGTHVVQLLRTYPDLRHGRDYPFARGGERSVARGYTKAVGARGGWSTSRTSTSGATTSATSSPEALREHPELHVIAVVPLHPDLDGGLGRHAAAAGPARAMLEMRRPRRTGSRSTASRTTPAHRSTCTPRAASIDDTWATIGSDNFNRRSWTHDSELSAVVRRPGTAELRPPAPAHARRRAPRPAATCRTTCSTDGRLRRARLGCSRRTPSPRPPWTPGTRAAGSGRGRRDGCAGWSRPSSAGWPGHSPRCRTSTCTTRTAGRVPCADATLSELSRPGVSRTACASSPPSFSSSCWLSRPASPTAREAFRPFFAVPSPASLAEDFTLSFGRATLLGLLHRMREGAGEHQPDSRAHHAP